MHKDIIRGQGVISHTVGMLRQVIKVLFFITLLTFAGSTYYKYKTCVTNENWREATAYFKAQLLSWNKDKEITSPYKVKGKDIKTKVKLILMDPFVKKSADKIEATLYEAVYLSLNISIFACGIVIYYFYRQGKSIEDKEAQRYISDNT